MPRAGNRLDEEAGKAVAEALKQMLMQTQALITKQAAFGGPGTTERVDLKPNAGQTRSNRDGDGGAGRSKRKLKSVAWATRGALEKKARSAKKQRW